MPKPPLGMSDIPACAGCGSWAGSAGVCFGDSPVFGGCFAVPQAAAAAGTAGPDRADGWTGTAKAVAWGP